MLILLLLVAFLPVTLCHAAMVPSGPLELGESEITEDGYVWDTGRNTGASTLNIVPTQGGYVEWDTSGIPDNATIGLIKVRYTCSNTPSTNRGIYLTQLELQPSVVGDLDLYNDVHNGTQYAITPLFQADTTFTVALSPDASTDLENLLASDWFAVGFDDSESSADMAYIYSEDDPDDPSPVLIVQYAYTQYNYTFYGLYYGNGTYSGPENVTCHDLDGSYPVNVTKIGVAGFNMRPQMFSWPAGTATRRIYPSADSESFYLFTPESDYAAYEFEIRDYTGQLDPGNTYLEAYRWVNGTARLVERMIIPDTYNKVPMTDTYGMTYQLKILWPTGSRFEWGYWVAGADPTPIIVIREVQFSQQAQITYRHVTVEATRPSGTQITVDYNDTLRQTQLVELSITLRNETVVHTDSTADDEKVFNWAGADGDTDYIVLVQIYHQFYGSNLHYRKELDADQTYPGIPDVTALGTFGGIATANLISITLSIFMFSAFTYQYGGDAGIVAGLSVVTGLAGMGYADYSYNFLAFLWFLGIVGILAGRMR